MPSFGVVVHFNVLNDLGLGILFIFKSPVFEQLCFESAEAGLHKSIIVSIVGPAHTLAYLMLVQQLPEHLTSVLSAPVRVQHHSFGNDSDGERLPQGRYHQLLLHLRFQFPAHNSS
nr:hypothetical protein [Adhaeribacter rhizoryzae]